MRRLKLKKMNRKLKQAPGSLIHVGEHTTEKTDLYMFHYDKDLVLEKQIFDDSECFLKNEKEGVCWLNVTGLHDTSVIERIGNNHNIHPLVQEDILNTMHRSKMEDLEEYLFVVLKMLHYDPVNKEINVEQVSFILNKNGLITFQERAGDVFDSVRERIRKGRGRILKSGTDYLLYALIDAVVDNYFLVLEAVGEDLQNLEDVMMDTPAKGTLEALHKIKQEIIFLRKNVRPLRETINSLVRLETELVSEETDVFFRDVHDHTVQIIETIETYREITAGLQDFYLSSAGNKMNEVMKVLTIISTLFIPLTFIAGIYGMNFDVMPELKWKAGYFFIWGIMVIVTIGMIIYFKRKKWF